MPLYLGLGEPAVAADRHAADVRFPHGVIPDLARVLPQEPLQVLRGLRLRDPELALQVLPVDVPVDRQHLPDPRLPLLRAPALTATHVGAPRAAAPRGTVAAARSTADTGSPRPSRCRSRRGRLPRCPSQRPTCLPP